jgi:hypothetical protein
VSESSSFRGFAVGTADALPRARTELLSEGDMKTETAGWKWVVHGVVESAAWVLALSVLGCLTIAFIG